MGRYDDDIATADELIRESGEECTLRQLIVTPPDPTKPWIPGTTVPREQPVQCVFLDFGSSKGKPGGETYFNGELVVRGDKKVLMSAKDRQFDPSVGCQLIRKSGAVWQLITMGDLNPNGQHVLYTWQARQ